MFLGTFTINTKAILVNAISFNATWVYPFNKLTKGETFYRADGETDELEIMYLEKAQLKYGINNEFNAELIEIPFQVITN